jgi:hypothetical protein
MLPILPHLPAESAPAAARCGPHDRGATLKESRGEAGGPPSPSRIPGGIMAA